MHSPLQSLHGHAPTERRPAHRPALLPPVRAANNDSPSVAAGLDKLNPAQQAALIYPLDAGFEASACGFVQEVRVAVAAQCGWESAARSLHVHTPLHQRFSLHILVAS